MPLGCTAISNQLHFCKSAPSEPEFKGNRPLQDQNAEHLHLRAFSEGGLYLPYLAFAVLQVAGRSAGCTPPVGKLQFCKSALPTGKTARPGHGAWFSSASITSNNVALGWTAIFPVNPSASWWSGSPVLSLVAPHSVNQQLPPHNLARAPTILRGHAGLHPNDLLGDVHRVYRSRVAGAEMSVGRF